MRQSVSALLFLVAFSAPANAFCLKRDLSKPAGWDWDHTVQPKGFSVADEFDRAFMVVTGKVQSVRNLHEASDPEGIAAMKYRIIPTETFKGPNLPEFTLYSSNDSGRALVEVGQTYLLFVLAAQGRSVTDNCGWSDELAKAGETLAKVRQLAAAKRPAHP